MTPKQLKDNALLEESIAHWKRMRDDPECTEHPTAKQCTLCQEYINKTPMNPCSECPVALKVLDNNCYSTPFYRAHHAWILKYHQKEAWLLAATKEIEFLESLITI